MAVIEFCDEKHGKLKSNSFGRGDWDVFSSYGGLVKTAKKGIARKISGSFVQNKKYMLTYFMKVVV